jgi:hypothetical protein
LATIPQDLALTRTTQLSIHDNCISLLAADETHKRLVHSDGDNVAIASRNQAGRTPVKALSPQFERNVNNLHCQQTFRKKISNRL